MLRHCSSFFFVRFFFFHLEVNNKVSGQTKSILEEVYHATSGDSVASR